MDEPIEWPEFYFKGLQKTSTVILPSKAPEREWEYESTPSSQGAFLGQIRPIERMGGRCTAPIHHG